MSTSDIVTAVIFFVFVGLLLTGASATLRRSIAYARRNIDQPILLPRDRDLLLGLTIPFVATGLVRLFGWREAIFDDAGDAEVWWVLLTGLPPIYALARYDWFELFRIERDVENDQ